MSVTGTQLLWRGQTGKHSSDSKKEYTGIYRATVDDPLDGPDVVLAGAALPEMGGPYAFGNDSNAEVQLKELAPRRMDGTRYVWDIQATWSSPEEKEDEKPDENGNTTSDPTRWAREYSFSVAKYQEPVEKATLLTAIPGREEKSVGPIVNSAGQVLDPPEQRDASLLVMRVIAYDLTFNASRAVLAEDCVNNDTLTWRSNGPYRFDLAIDPYQAKVDHIGGTLMRTPSGIVYWKQEAEIHIKRDGWRIEVLDRGTHRLATIGSYDGVGGIISPSDIVQGVPETVRILDRNGKPVATPVLLDGNGQPLPANGKPVYLKYAKYREIPFSILNL